MRILSVDPYYPAFLDSVYADSPELARLPYDEQWRSLMDRAFGVADFYSSNLRRLGHEATEIVPNCVPLQERWLAENPDGETPPGRPGDADRLAAILLRQIRSFRPDVLHVQDCINTSPRLLAAARSWTRRITTQIACPYPEDLDFSPYDLVLSSMPHFVREFRRRGLRAEPFRLGFESSLLDRVPPRERRGALFVGGLSPAHGKRRRLLEALAAEDLIEWWGYGADQLPPESPLRARYRGEAWGLQMYGLLAGCAVALNDHIDVAGEHANNMRLYEATGVGALLLTDAKRDLAEYFEPGREVLAYDDAGDCAAKIRWALARPQEARAIAQAGQRRTVAENSYLDRMREFAGLIAALG